MITVISSLVAAALAPPTIEPPAAIVVYEEIVEEQEIVEENKEAPVPDPPSHSCDSIHHDDLLEVAALAHDSGFPGAELHTAVAVAYAESLGNATALGRNRNGSTDSGLWQINSIHGYSDLENPHVNARAAFEVWSHSGWTAWYAHTPRGGEYGSGERFKHWLKESRCTLDFYHEKVVYYSLIEERNKGEDNRIDAVPALR